jgi:uncharacterized membrane protein
VCGVLILLASTSEVARFAASLSADSTAREAAVSIWWGVFGLGLVVAGFLGAGATIRRAGLALVGVAVAKALLFDLANVRLEGRVASFLGLGLLMLGVAVLYNRIAARATKRAAVAAGGGAEPVVSSGP